MRVFGKPVLGLGLVLLLGACGSPTDTRDEPSRPSFITFGTPDPGHPHVGTLLFVQNGVGFFSCTGTLLSPTVMLTAGHCTESEGKTNDVTYVRFTQDALAGRKNYSSTQAWLNAEWIRAKKVIPHPLFDDFSQFPNTYDAGLVILPKPGVSLSLWCLAPARPARHAEWTEQALHRCRVWHAGPDQAVRERYLRPLSRHDPVDRGEQHLQWGRSERQVYQQPGSGWRHLLRRLGWADLRGDQQCDRGDHVLRIYPLHRRGFQFPDRYSNRARLHQAVSELNQRGPRFWPGPPVRDCSSPTWLARNNPGDRLFASVALDARRSVPDAFRELAEREL
jgi:hypothetical protein